MKLNELFEENILGAMVADFSASDRASDAEERREDERERATPSPYQSETPNHTVFTFTAAGKKITHDRWESDPNQIPDTLDDIIREYANSRFAVHEKIILQISPEDVAKYREYTRLPKDESGFTGKKSGAEFEKQKARIAKDGIQSPLVLNIKRGNHGKFIVYLGEGNHRLRAALELGMKAVPVRFFYGRTDELFEDRIDERLKKVKGKWALVSKSDPKKVLQYYDGPKGQKPSKEWVAKVERRVQAYKHSK